MLEIKSGPLAGKVIPVRPGQVLTVGRTQRASVPIPQDTYLSGIHFAVECGKDACRLIDRQSANGTFVNGAKVTEVVIQNGDVVFAGKTTFGIAILETAPSQVSAPPRTPVSPQAAALASSVIPAASATLRPEAAERARAAPVSQPPPAPAATPAPTAPSSGQRRLTVGHWTFGVVPEGWEVVDGFGVRRMGKGVFPSEAMVSEELLRAGATFDRYVAGQLDLVRLLVSQPQIEPAGPPPITGVEESKAFVVRYRTDDGRRFLQRQVFVRQGQLAGALALTTLESELPRIEPLFEQIVQGMRFAGS
jgi:pSer/pThr/pTyr-binding forkhead associated (FHA) protein